MDKFGFGNSQEAKKITDFVDKIPKKALFQGRIFLFGYEYVMMKAASKLYSSEFARPPATGDLQKEGVTNGLHGQNGQI